MRRRVVANRTRATLDSDKPVTPTLSVGGGQLRLILGRGNATWRSGPVGAVGARWSLAGRDVKAVLL